MDDMASQDADLFGIGAAESAAGGAASQVGVCVLGVYLWVSDGQHMVVWWPSCSV